MARANQKLAYINDPDVWDYICTLTNFSAWVRLQAQREIRKIKRKAVKQ